MACVQGEKRTHGCGVNRREAWSLRSKLYGEYSERVLHITGLVTGRYRVNVLVVLIQIN